MVEIGSVAPRQFCRPCLKDGPTSAFDFLASVGQIDEKSPTFSCTAALVPRHRLAVTCWRSQPQMVSSALKSGL